MRIRFHRAARRHRVSAARARYVIGTTEPMQRIGASREGLDLLTWVGVDPRGEELEIVAVDYGDGRVDVIHAMPTKYRS